MSPTARSLGYLREHGYIAEVVERWIPFAKIRKDFLGVIDILALKEGEAGVLGVQTTTASHTANRMQKASGSQALAVWLKCGNKFEVWGWSKRGPRNQRKTWTLDRSTINNG